MDPLRPESHRLTATMAKASRARAMRARGDEAAARQRLTDAQSRRDGLAEATRQREAELMPIGQAVPAAVVQLVGASRHADRQAMEGADATVRLEERALRHQHEVRIEAGLRERSAAHIAAYVATARRTALTERADRQIEDDAAMHVAVTAD